MFLSEQELTVQVGQVNRIEIDDVNFAKACQNEIFQQFASDTASADHEHTRLDRFVSNWKYCATEVGGAKAEAVRPVLGANRP